MAFYRRYTEYFIKRQAREGRPAGWTDPALSASRDGCTNRRQELVLRRGLLALGIFGVIKAVLGFAGFSLRGLDKVEGEWTLVALAYNCKRLHKLSLAT